MRSSLHPAGSSIGSSGAGSPLNAMAELLDTIIGEAIRFSLVKFKQFGGAVLPANLRAIRATISSKPTIYPGLLNVSSLFGWDG
jgi:hypothetical protein